MLTPRLIKRWKFERYEDAPHDNGFVEDPNGDMVDYTDYALLESENAKLQERLAEAEKEKVELRGEVIDECVTFVYDNVKNYQDTNVKSGLRESTCLLQSIRIKANHDTTE